MRNARDMLSRAQDGILLFGLTPPRASVTAQRADEIARTTLDRLSGVKLDGLVLYDVDAEAERSSQPRPFPFMPMMNPTDYLANHLADWDGPVVVYRSVGKCGTDELARWMRDIDPERVLAVFAGATSRRQAVRTRLDDAYRLYADLGGPVALGGVLIPERHGTARVEHLRMLSKDARGCTFFVSQVNYELDPMLNVLSDYANACRERGLPPSPIIVTLAPCGSVATLEFMLWLGIAVPSWLQSAIKTSGDPLGVSYEQCMSNAGAVVALCRRLGLPFGINVESLTNRKVEIDAAVELVREIRGILQ